MMITLCAINLSMLSNSNNLSQIPQLSFRGLLSAPKGCLCIYDHQSYVQIAGGLLLISKFIFGSDQSPKYLSYPLHNPQSRILDLVVTTDGKITILTVNTLGLYQLIIYTDGEPSTLKVETKEATFVRSYCYDNDICYIFQGSEPECYTQIYWIESMLKKVKAVGILPDKVKFCVIDDLHLNLLLRTKIESYKSENKALCYDVASTVDEETVGFIDLSGRVVTYTADRIDIIKDERVMQSIPLEGIKQVVGVTLGFVVLAEGKVYHYQRRGDILILMDVMEIEGQYQWMEIARKEHLMLLKASNGLVSIIELNNNRIDQNDNKRSFGGIYLVRNQEEHISLVAISKDTNPYLIIVKQESSQLIIFSKITLEQILVYKIDVSPIYDCQLQSNRPYFLLSAAGVVRKLYVLYDHIEESVQINLRARRLVLSANNCYVACLVGAANFSKVQIVWQEDLKDVAGLWVGQEVVEIVWSENDADVYVVLERGYERYSLSDGFGSKKVKEFGGNVVSVGGYSKSKGGLVVLLGDMTVNVIRNQEVIGTYKQDQLMSSISVKSSILFMATQKGTLLSNLMDSKHPPSQLRLFLGEFSVLDSSTNQVICLSKDRTILFIMRARDKDKQIAETSRALKGQKGESLAQQKLKSLQQKDITFVQRSFIKWIMKKEKHHQEKSHQVYEEMQDTVREIERRYQHTLGVQKEQFSAQIKDVENSLEEEIENSKKLEREVRENKEKYENEQLKALADLEKLYDRKITLLTNKLMTESEISMRNTIQSNENIESLHLKYRQDIVKMNAAFEERRRQLEQMDISEKQKNQRLVVEYEERLSQQHQESENLVRSIQIQYQEMVNMEKRSVFQWQEKHKKCVAEKINVEEAITKLKLDNEEFEKKNRRQQESMEHQKKRIVFLNKEIEKLSKHIRDLQIQLDRQRANSYELSQSNQVLGFKILENREAILPKQRKLEELKEKFCSFEVEYQKVLAEVSEQAQIIDQLRKENIILKREIATMKDVQQKEHRNFVNLLYDIREIVTETPTEDWNRKISVIYQDINNRGLFPTETQNVRKNKKSMIEEIDRSKNHLELCLKQVITSNNKIQERKSHELLKKLKENADLLQEINELRTKLKKYELIDPFKEKEKEKNVRFGKRSMSYKKEEQQRQRVATEIIQEQEGEESNVTLIQNTPTSKKQQSRGFQSTSVDFRKSTTTKKDVGERITRNTMRKAPIQLVKLKKSRDAENQEMQFLYRKVELQEKIIISLRAKVSGVSL